MGVKQQYERGIILNFLTKVDVALVNAEDSDLQLCPNVRILTSWFLFCQNPLGLPILPSLGFYIDWCITKIYQCYLLAAFFISGQLIAATQHRHSVLISKGINKHLAYNNFYP